MNSSLGIFFKIVLFVWFQSLLSKIWPSATPQVLLLFVTLLTLERGSKEAFFWSVGVGLFLDVLSSQKFGMNIFLYSATAYLIGFFKETFFRENVFLKIILSVVGLALFLVLRLAFYSFFQSDLYEGNFWQFLSIQTWFWSLLFIPFCDWVLYWGMGSKTRRVF